MSWFKIGDEITYHILEKAVTWLLSSLGIKKPSTTDPKPTEGSSSGDNQKDDAYDWHAVANIDRFMPLENRKNLDEAIRALPTEDERDLAEQLFGKVLTQVKDGYFKARPQTTTKKSSRPPRGGKGPAETSEETTTRETFPAGFEPEVLTKEFLTDSTKTVEAAKLMLARLLQKSRKQKAEEAAKRAMQKSEEFIRKGAKKALWILLFYLVAVVVSGFMAYTKVSDALANPEHASSLAWGLVFTVIFGWLISPFIRLILPKE